MPKLSSTAPSVPPCLGPDSTRAWARLRNYVAHAERRTLLVIRHDSPRLPRELPPLLAEESGRQLVTATVSDSEPDPMAAALRAAPGAEFPAGCILTITGAEDLDIKAADDSRAALHEFARRLDLRRDQFLPAGGIVLVWATARVFDALAEHALNFISRAAAVLTLAAAGEGLEMTSPTTTTTPSPRYHGAYRLPPLPANAPSDLHDALDALDELALANELYLQGGPKTAHGLARFDTARDRIEAGWIAAHRWSGLDSDNEDSPSTKDDVHDFARALLAAYPWAGAHVLSLRQHPRERIVWLEAALAAARHRGDRRGEGSALRNLGLAHAALGDARKAIEFHEQALGIDRMIGDRQGEGSDLSNLGNSYADMGDARKAIEYYEERLVIAGEIGDRPGESIALGNLGRVYADMGNAFKAVSFYEKALGIARETGDRRGEGIDLINLGLAHAALGDARKAIDYYEHALAIDREIGDRRGEAANLWNSALAHDSLGNRPEAIARAAAALAIYEDIENPWAAKVHAKLAEWQK